MNKILATLMLLGVAAFALMVVNIGKGNAREDDEFKSRAQIGLRIAPLPLNLEGRDAELVGYGSYIVNAVVDCNGCHSMQEYAKGGDPFLGQPKRIDATDYLRGGLKLPGDNGQLVTSRNIRPGSRRDYRPRRPSPSSRPSSIMGPTSTTPVRSSRSCLGPGFRTWPATTSVRSMSICRHCRRPRLWAEVDPGRGSGRDETRRPHD